MRALLLLPCASLLLACGQASTAGDGGVDAGAPGPTCLATEAPDPQVDGGACPIVRPGARDALDDALMLVGLDRCTLGYAEADWSGWGSAARRHDPFHLPFFDRAHDFAVNAPPFAEKLTRGLDAASRSPTPVASALLLAGNRLAVMPLAPCMVAATVDPENPLARAVAQLITAAGGAPDEAALAADAADVPLPLQLAAAEVVLAASAASTAWNALVAPLGETGLGTLTQVAGLILLGEASPDLSDPDQKAALATGLDPGTLVDGAIHLAWAVEHADLGRFAGLRGFQFDQQTPLGRVVLRDAADDTYPEGDAASAILLVIDTGGNDTYLRPVGAVGGEGNPGHVGLAVDLAGRDTYGYEEVPLPADGKRLPSDSDGRLRPQGGNGPVSASTQPRQGGARLGYGFLFDLGTDDDHYRSLRMSQGFGASGVGVLYDAGGNDTYEGEAAVQGSAIFGVGLLLDQAGNDTYRTYTLSQGFGFVRGAGILYDGAGADRYLADVGDPAIGGDPLYYTPQLPGVGNSSFVQGAGFGRRASGDLDPKSSDRVYMSGGLGVLRDLAGDDVYTASVFGQGTGYWFGTGILADGAGNDHYDGKWYVQGSAAHAALCLFLDDSGDDQYNQTVVPAATSIGVGHDYSVSFHIDRGGKDLYRGPGLSIGAGHANGVGVFLNTGGDDEYRSSGTLTVGAATIGDAAGYAPRFGMPTIGLFLDLGGKDRYDITSGPMRADDTTWINNLSPADGNPYGDHGAGVDRESGTVSFP